MVKISDLRMREVVNVIDGKRLGPIKDIELDADAGCIKAVVLPGSGRLMGLFGRNDDIVVPWSKVRKIGVDVILIELTGVSGLSNYCDPIDYE